MARLPPDDSSLSVRDSRPELDTSLAAANVPPPTADGVDSVADSSSSQSVASPDPLSRAVYQPGYLDPKPAATAASHSVLSPPPSEAVLRQPPQSQNLLSPPETQPSGAYYGRRTSNPSPFASSGRETLGHEAPSTIASPSDRPVAGNGTHRPGPIASRSLTRTVSADDAAVTSSQQVIRRLAQQNSRIREAWEAERKYMEANRERVEEVYKEERVIMEQERSEWEMERAAMAAEIQNLRRQVAGLENNTLRLQDMVQRFELENAGKGADQNIAASASASATGSDKDGCKDMSVASPSHTSLVANNRRASAPGTNGVRGIELSIQAPAYRASALDTHVQLSKPQHPSPGGSMMSPPRLPGHLSSNLLDTNMRLLSSPPVDFLGSPKGEDVPIVDIQSIHPELEGIPLRAPAVQKETFTDAGSDDSISSSQKDSPLGESDKLFRRRSSKGQTLQILAAPEPERLRMHAGHTPSHSLSLLPTAPITEATTASESATPTESRLRDLSERLAAPRGEGGQGKGPRRVEDSVAFELEASVEDIPGAEPEPQLEAEGDPELKGPLMVRNIPAHDEVFFRRLSERLEGVSRGQDSTPVCIQEGEAADASKINKENVLDGQTGGDGANDMSAILDESSTANIPRPKDDPVEIPLKIKKTTNFGAPLGAIF